MSTDRDGRDANPDATLPWSASIDLPGVRGPVSDFGNYELLEEIGRGGMGIVFRARQKDLDRVVAVKMILPGRLADREQVLRFQAEARAAAALQHPNVVHVHEAGQRDGQHYFAMEYMAGDGLAGLIRAGPVPPEAAARLLATVARAVAYLHLHGVVHRDLKPSNILLNEFGDPCVSDFGLVKVRGSECGVSSPGLVVGTPSYMAPEQAAGRTEDVGPGSDVYSLGAILYEMLTGRPPFQGPSALDTLVQVLEGEAPAPRGLNPRVPFELESICLRCLEKSPGDRYPSADALVDDLERFLRGEDPEAARGGAWRRLYRWARREPALSSRLACVLLVAVTSESRYRRYPVEARDARLPCLALLAVYAALCFGFQAALRRGRSAEAARVGWVAADAALFTFWLLILQAVESSVMFVYALLVVGSGLWFRTRLVWLATALSVASYGVLLVDFRARGRVLHYPNSPPTIVVCLVVLGFVVSYQVRHIRAISRYYEGRPLP